LLGLLDVPRVYDLERFDLEVGTTVDAGLQRAATETLRSLRDPAGAKAAGLYGYRLLNEGDATDKVILSFTLFERGEHANWLRVQTDNFDQPFDVNEGARLDMGSTAKLRTLITYLELVADLHRRLSAHDAQALPAPRLHPKDNLGRWARAYLARARDRGLAPMLEAALQRTYSASPAETFFTGGGAHRFENFDRAEDGRVYTVRDAFKHSVNLVFIRLMRDIVQHLIYGEPGARSGLLDDPANPHRREYLARFADREGRQFIAGFYRKYRGLPAAEAEDLLLRSTGATPVRLASVYGALEPDGSAAGFAAFLAARLPRARLSEPAIQALFEKYGPQRWSWADRGYLAGVHPLELWLVAYLRRHPGAGLFDVFEASRDERQDAYTWLFRTRNKSAQDLRIRMLLELDAFAEIQRSWRRLGYPFEALTPSYATAIGASGDRPAALAELMGIVVNDGMRLPVRRIKSLTFAGGTPYETRLVVRPSEPQRVLAPEVAWLVRRSLVDVVEDGTARRIKGALARPDGVPVEVGGKTGTGDHRFEVYASDGRLVSSRVVARSATFVFLIGDRYFGTLMAYVPEPDAARYKFTSALPAQLLKSMAPALTPLVEERVCAPHGMSVAASAPAASIGGAR
jgi:membrane peptidoglycan carboxypeptidase